MAGELQATPSSSLDMALSASGAVTALQDPPDPRRPLLLKNKLPRWNAGAAQLQSDGTPWSFICIESLPGCRAHDAILILILMGRSGALLVCRAHVGRGPTSYDRCSQDGNRVVRCWSAVQCIECEK